MEPVPEGTKRWTHIWLLLALIVTLSFGLGYLIAKQANPTPIVIEQRQPVEK